MANNDRQDDGLGTAEQVGLMAILAIVLFMGLMARSAFESIINSL